MPSLYVEHSLLSGWAGLTPLERVCVNLVHLSCRLNRASFSHCLCTAAAAVAASLFYNHHRWLNATAFSRYHQSIPRKGCSMASVPSLSAETRSTFEAGLAYLECISHFRACRIVSAVLPFLPSLNRCCSYPSCSAVHANLSSFIVSG